MLRDRNPKTEIANFQLKIILGSGEDEWLRLLRRTFERLSSFKNDKCTPHLTLVGDAGNSSQGAEKIATIRLEVGPMGFSSLSLGRRRVNSSSYFGRICTGPISRNVRRSAKRGQSFQSRYLSCCSTEAPDSFINPFCLVTTVKHPGLKEKHECCSLLLES